ncbi:Hypothetical protein MVR_LOCUS323 [uncultured virus]|nr:Hypothetical protein MVR_LOCUS323 [uncultured virus]
MGSIFYFARVDRLFGLVAADLDPDRDLGLAAGFLAADLDPDGFLAAGFLVAGFLAAAVLEAGFLAAGFLAAGLRVAADLDAGFLAAGFLAALVVPVTIPCCFLYAFQCLAAIFMYSVLGRPGLEARRLRISGPTNSL